MKAENQKPSGLPQEIQVRVWKWEDINIDFVVGVPHTEKQYDSIWVVVDSLRKFAYFIPVKSTYPGEDYERIFIYEIVCHHDIQLSIILVWVHNSHLNFGGHSKKGWVPR